jgi:hypothetical protein
MTMLAMLQAAASATVDGVRAGAATATDNPSATLGLAVVVPFLLQALKNSPMFPLLTRNSARINFTVGVVCAFASVVGIHATYDISTGGTITLPPLHTVWQAFIQWAGQQVTYKGLVVPAETLGDIRNELRDMRIGQMVDRQRVTLPPVLPPAARPAPDEGRL